MKTNGQHDDRIQRALEGLLSPEELVAFKTDVASDADLRAAYVTQLSLHAQLQSERDMLKTILNDEPSAELATPVMTSRRWPVLVRLVAAAACAVLVAWGWQAFSSRPVATLVQAENCKWAGSELPTVVAAKLGRGRLALVEGIATLRFQSGATVTMEAPTTLDILTAMHCRLIEGTVTAEVPEPAHGFTIDTPDIKVVDLGTKFGVTAASTGNSQVRVFQGEVEIGGLENGEIKRLTEGKGIHVGGASTTSGDEPMRETVMQEEGGWTAISTAFGRGKDAYVRRGWEQKPQGHEPLLIVKHTEMEVGRKNERRAILTFDVSQVDLSQIHEAQLVLDPEPSGFGFSSMVPDSRFAVYGLVDGPADSWSEDDIRWSTLPGCTDDGVIGTQVRRLAEFWMPRGGSGNVLTIRGESLAAFARSDRDGLISFLILRETGESDSSGLAHGFASKEHPSARPPTLRLK